MVILLFHFQYTDCLPNLIMISNKQSLHTRILMNRCTCSRYAPIEKQQGKYFQRANNQQSKTLFYLETHSYPPSAETRPLLPIRRPWSFHPFILWRSLSTMKLHAHERKKRRRNRSFSTAKIFPLCSRALACYTPFPFRVCSSYSPSTCGNLALSSRLLFT